MKKEEYKDGRFPMNSMRICIDKYENVEITGRIYARASKEVMNFVSCKDMLLKVDLLFDEICFPQSFQEKRTFRAQKTDNYSRNKLKTLMESEYIHQQSGKYGTFDILVQTRCRACWQGMMRNLNTEEKFDFESEMKLLKKIVDTVEKEYN